MLALFPNDSNLAYIFLAILHEAKGQFREAVAAIERVPSNAPEAPMTMGLRYAFAGLAGYVDRAREGFKQLKASRQTSYIPATQIGLAALGCRDYDAAVHWLAMGAEVEREPVCIWFNVFPFFRHLRGHPGFRELIINKMRLRFEDE